MNKKNIIIAAIGIAVVIILTMLVSRLSIPEEVKMNQVAEAAAPVEAPKPVPRFTHQQETWIAALEWCESKAKNTAINPSDRDGTKSYYAFQFKPGTFRSYGEKYGIIKKGKTDSEIMQLLKEYKLQRAIVESMVEDPSIKWEQQFPDCVKNKIGRPPKQ